MSLFTLPQVNNNFCLGTLLLLLKKKKKSNWWTTKANIIQKDKNKLNNIIFKTMQKLSIRSKKTLHHEEILYHTHI